MSGDDETPQPTNWSGAVQLRSAERVLGVLHVDLHAAADPDLDHQDHAAPSRWSWEGRVNGSDYLVWGANLTKTQIEFPWGERADVVLRAGGRLQGLGATPTALCTPLAAGRTSGAETASRAESETKE